MTTIDKTRRAADFGETQHGGRKGIGTSADTYIIDQLLPHKAAAQLTPQHVCDAYRVHGEFCFIVYRRPAMLSSRLVLDLVDVTEPTDDAQTLAFELGARHRHGQGRTARRQGAFDHDDGAALLGDRCLYIHREMSA